MLCISGKYLVQQMQLEVNMQARAVLGGHCMTIGRVWVGLLRLIHLHMHSAIPPHIPALTDTEIFVRAATKAIVNGF